MQKNMIKYAIKLWPIIFKLSLRENETSAMIFNRLMWENLLYLCKRNYINY